MVLNKAEKTEKNLYELEFTIDKATFDAAVDKVYRKNVKKINVPGFRRGKAPKSIIEKMYGSGVFYEDAINDLLPEAYSDAVKEADIKVVSQPDFDVVSIDEKGLTMTAKVYVKPDVAISDYVGIKATKDVAAVTEEEVNAEIDRVRERNARVLDINDRPAAMGDTVVIDFDGYLDGERFEGGKAEGHTLKLGSGQFIPGFEDQIVGKNIGEEFDVNVTFPEDYHAQELAGKPAVFKVVLHEIKSEELPAPDDEFAKDVSEFDTFAEYKADVEAKIKARHESAADAEVEEQLIDALMDKLEADIPEAMFVTETENFVRDYDNRLRMQGMDLNTYFKYTGQTLDDLRKQFRPQAERQVKTRLALEKIVELEGIVATEDEIEEEYKRIADAYGMTVDKVKETVDRDAIAEDMKVKKAVDFVKEKATVTKKRKTAAKKTAASDKPAEKKAETAEKKADTTEKKAPAKRTSKAKSKAQDAPAGEKAE